MSACLVQGSCFLPLYRVGTFGLERRQEVPESFLQFLVGAIQDQTRETRGDAHAGI